MSASKPVPRRETPSVERLRADIDEGRTGEKVRYPDPAAAPLGADDEAAGNPPTAEERRREQESRPRGAPPARQEPGALMLYVLLIVGIALVLAASLVLLRG